MGTPKVGTTFTHKGEDYKVVAVKENQILVKGADEKTRSLSFANAIYLEHFGDKDIDIAEPDLVDMSEFKKPAKDVKSGTQGSEAPKKAEKQEPETSEDEKPKKTSSKKAKAEKQEPEIDPFEIDWDNEVSDYLTALLQFDELDPAKRLTTIWAWTKSPQLEPLAKAVLFFGYYRSLSNYDYEIIKEKVFKEGKCGTGTLHEIKWEALNEVMGRAAKKAKLTDKDYEDIVSFVPSDHLYKRLFCQMLCDGCFIYYGYTVKGIKDSIIKAIFEDVYLIDLPEIK